MKKLLTTEEYEELLAEFENKRQKKPKTSSHTDSGKKIRRLNCLRQQLSQVSVE